MKGFKHTGRGPKYGEHTFHAKHGFSGSTGKVRSVRGYAQAVPQAPIAPPPLAVAPPDQQPQIPGPAPGAAPLGLKRGGAVNSCGAKMKKSAGGAANSCGTRGGTKKSGGMGKFSSMPWIMK